MSDWIDVDKVEAFGAGEMRTVDADDTEILVINLDGEYFAIEDMCSHEEEPLSGGCIEGDKISCPRHDAHFSIRTGEALTPPAYEPVATFPVRVENGMVQVKDARWD